MALPQQKTTAPTPKPPPPPSKMKLGAVVKGRQQEPITALLFGVEGIGKSTFGADAPSPIFLDGERGTEEMDVARFPTPESWEDVRAAVRELINEDHAYRTFVVDTLDWIEPLLWRHVCEQAKVATIEEVGGGFGKGYVAALDGWRGLLADLERLRTAKKMHVILLAHSWIKSFKNPEGEDYDRYELKLNAKAAGLLKEWPKAVLFANYETIAAKDQRTKRVRGVSTGARLLYTTRTAAYDAKNRYSLPESLPLSWADFYAATQAAQVAEPAVLREEAISRAAALPAPFNTQATEALGRAGDDPQKLAQLINWINSKTAQTAPKEQ